MKSLLKKYLSWFLPLLLIGISSSAQAEGSLLDATPTNFTIYALLAGVFLLLLAFVAVVLIFYVAFTLKRNRNTNYSA